ncbi:acyl CoA binding protein-domain-containing protein [Gongronella butleri]|nr:acyl CoA binding protein-domain-containing protein [Gongronella butleri]
MAAASSEPQLFNRQAQLRYNKALQIVQSLSSDSFQPTKNQKLKLYALYKQVTQGDVNTSRPGMFDVVGRAKWDAWKDLQGIGRVEAQHQYVETLLQAAKEAYTSHPASKAKAQEILQALASVRPMEDDDTTTTATTTTDDDDVSLSEDDDDDDRQQGSPKFQKSVNSSPFYSFLPL